MCNAWEKVVADKWKQGVSLNGGDHENLKKISKTINNNLKILI
jgi:hypothetical protein